jgi:hypothetical protein
MDAHYPYMEFIKNKGCAATASKKMPQIATPKTRTYIGKYAVLFFRAAIVTIQSSF